MTDLSELETQLWAVIVPPLPEPDPLVFSSVDDLVRTLDAYQVIHRGVWGTENYASLETLFTQLTTDNEARLYVQRIGGVDTLSLYRKVLAVRIVYDVRKESKVFDRSSFVYCPARAGSADTNGTLIEVNGIPVPRKLSGRCILMEFKRPNGSLEFTAAKHPTNASETMRFDESIDETVARLCKEELRFIRPSPEDIRSFKPAPSHWFDIRPGGSATGLPHGPADYFRDHVESSTKYPGLRSYKDIATYYFEMTDELFDPDGFQEQGKNKLNVFKWRIISV